MILDSHCHVKLLHPLPLIFLCFTEELEALLSLKVDQVETVRPLRRKNVSEEQMAERNVDGNGEDKRGSSVSKLICTTQYSQRDHI